VQAHTTQQTFTGEMYTAVLFHGRLFFSDETGITCGYILAPVTERYYNPTHAYLHI
jgi:hypothetical protein